MCCPVFGGNYSAVWQKQSKQKENLTGIIPIIFYHGQEKWKKQIFEKEFYGLDENIIHT
ncbi:MAG: Rpn family recombination-promoting nuclease/putative transposase [Bacteroidales bacterium]|nr:Rpn family recombination-promoting nuclease/putative transposase [Bacteroidales bacterium]